MKIAGFFEELWPSRFGEHRHPIRDSLNASDYPDEGGITEYLRAGREVLSVMGVAEDVLGTGEEILGGDSIYTDGEWLWRGDLWFYVRWHHVSLPEAFLSRIRQHNYSLPEVSRPQLVAAVTYVEERW